MGNLRSTVVMKTDIRGFTTRVGMLSELDLSKLLSGHKQFIVEKIANYQGLIVKGEGDAFWMIFPSVTAASLAALEIQGELRLTQTGKGEDARLAVRIVITLGDVLHHDNDIFGEAVNLAARIESITPADGVYLSHAAWLSLNRTEVSTTFVGEFNLKGISEVSRIYKLDQEHRTRIVKDQAIVFTDIRGMTSYTGSRPIEDVEKLLLHHEMIHNLACEEFGGTTRLFLGDGCFMTFPKSQLALAAVEKLFVEWEKFVQVNAIPCSLKAGLHKGDLYLFRSYVFGRDINVAAKLEGMLSTYLTSEKCRALVTGIVRDELDDDVRRNRLRQVEVRLDLLSNQEMNPVYLYEIDEELL